jgi:hypothetical protein
VKRAAALLPLLALACHSGKPASGGGDRPGDRLERAALASGLVRDSARVEVAGLYAREGDRVCVIPFGEEFRVGAVVSFDDGPSCEAAGTARQVGATLAVRFGEACRFDAMIDDDRITFPVDMPAACERLCTGRASIAGLVADRLSAGVSEAEALRGVHGRTLCTG